VLRASPATDRSLVGGNFGRGVASDVAGRMVLADIKPLLFSSLHCQLYINTILDCISRDHLVNETQVLFWC
jgi:hypothetical protein